MEITERMRQLLNSKDARTKELEELTGIDRNRWNNLRKTNPTAKVRAEEVEALAKLYPEYAYWITTGKTLPEAGQISPASINVNTGSLKERLLKAETLEEMERITDSYITHDEVSKTKD